MVSDSDQAVWLQRWEGPWDEDDPDANFKADVAAYGLLDPMVTVRGMSESLGIPPGAIVRYVMAKWATSGSGGLMEVGPHMVNQLWEPVERAETAGCDEQRLEAYHQLRHMVSWLKFPLDHPEVYPSQEGPGS